LFSVSTIFSQTTRDSILVKNEVYEILYSEKLEQPLIVKYRVLCQDNIVSRKGMDFYTEKLYKTSSTKDYEGNNYDKGHCAPANDFSCDKDLLIKTFSYLNCSLQNKFLNRGVWKSLELHENELSKKFVVDVEIQLVFNKKCKMLKTGATPPYAFIKIIKYNNVIEKYYFLNKKPKHTDFKKYKKK
jgi:DNA/RNA endonuclease G (NUC1)